MGFWHLEPIVLGLNGVLLTGAAIYALINAIGSILCRRTRTLRRSYGLRRNFDRSRRWNG